MSSETPDPEATVTTLEETVANIQGLIDEIESYSDPSVKRKVFELLDWLDTLHREALSRLAGGLESVGFLDKALDDPFVAHLFSIYGFFEETDPAPLVEDALAEVRPYVHSHGGEIEVTGIQGGVVQVRMHGSCSGCPSSVVTLTQSFEKAVRSRWPALIRIEVEDDEKDSKWQTVTINRS